MVARGWGKMKCFSIVIVLGLAVVACNSQPLEPLADPFESIIPNCEFFEPFFDREDHGGAVANYGNGSFVNRAIRRCYGNEVQLVMGMIEFSSPSEASVWVDAAKSFWEADRNVFRYTSDERGPAYVWETSYRQIDRILSIDLGYAFECSLNDYYPPGALQMRIFRVGRFGGEYALRDCIIYADGKNPTKAIRLALDDYVALTERLGLLDWGALDFTDHIISHIAMGETYSRINSKQNID